MSLLKMTTEEHLVQARFWAHEAERAHETMVDCANITTSLATLSITHSLLAIAQAMTSLPVIESYQPES